MAQTEDTLTTGLKVRRFVRSYEPGHLDLACHAALPLLLTPELLNFLRNRFLPGQVPWVAEADLLLSDLCSEVGYETYAMEPEVRAYLLRLLSERYGPRRMRDVALLLISYVRHLSQTSPGSRPHELQSQQWAALLYLDDRRDEAVRELAESFRECAAALGGGEAAAATAHRAEMLRLSNLVHELAQQLGDYPELVGYAQLTRELLSSQVTSVPEHLRRERQFRQPTELPGGTILPPVGTLLGAAATEARVMRRRALLLGFEADNPRLPELSMRDLTYSLHHALAASGFAVRSLFRATAGELYQELASQAREKTPDDLLLFYFSGYADLDIHTPRIWLSSNSGEGGDRGVTLLDLNVLLNALRGAAGKVVVFLDPLIQGESDQWQSRLDEAINSQTGGGPFALLAPDLHRSVRSGSPSTTPNAHGFFTQCLINVLAERAGGADEPLTPRGLHELLMRMYDLAGADISVGRPVTWVMGSGELVIDETRPHKLSDGHRTEEKANPFDKSSQEVGEPFGREALLAELISSVMRGENVLLVGGVGMGKSELLRALCDVGARAMNLPPDAFVYMNLRDVRNDEELIDELSHELKLKADYRLLHSVLARPRDPFIQRLSRIAVLCLDNIDRAYEAGVPVLPILRRISNEPTLVLAGRSEAFGREAMRLRFRVVELPELTEAEAREAVGRRLSGSGVEFTEDELKAVVEQGQGNPSRLRRAAAELFEARRGTHGPGVAPETEADAGSRPAPATTRLPPSGYISYNPRQLPPGTLNGLLRELVSGVRYELSRLIESPAEIFLEPGQGKSEGFHRFLETQLQSASFFLPIISENYFDKKYCRSELERFLVRERDLGRNDLIFPIFLDKLTTKDLSPDDPLAAEIKRRQAQSVTLSTEASEGSLGETVRRLADVIAAALRRSGSGDAQQSAAADTRPPESFAAKMAALRSVPGFSSLSTDAAIGAAGGMKYVTFDPGETILKIRSTEPSLYIILQGEAQAGKARPTRRMLPGGFINLPGLLTGEPSQHHWVAGPQGAACYRFDKVGLASVFERSRDLPEQIAEQYVELTETTMRARPSHKKRLAEQMRAFYQLGPAPAEKAPGAPRPFDVSGRTLVVDGRGTSDFLTVGDAIEKARTGDRILIRPGVYREALLVSKRLELVGDRSVPSEVVIESKGRDGVSFSAPRGRLQNLTLRATSKRSLFGVRVSKGELEVTDCKIEGFGEDGVEVEYGGAASISATVISKCSTGVCFEGRGQLRYCEIKNNLSMGVYVGARGRALIDDNDISDNADFGINITNGGSATITANRLVGNRRRAIEPAKLDEQRVQLLDNYITEPELKASRPRRSAPAAGRKGGKKRALSPGKGSKGGSKSSPVRASGSKGGSKSVSRSVGKKASKKAKKRSPKKR